MACFVKNTVRFMCDDHAGMPYDLQSKDNFSTAFTAHQQWQRTVLAAADTQAPPPAVLVQMHEVAGLGNRIPSLVTGYLMALLTGRVFLLQPSPKLRLTDYLTFNVPCNYDEYRGLYSKSSQCKVREYQQLANSNLSLCHTGDGVGAPDANIVVYTSLDYDVPLLQVNPALSAHFDRLFPDGEVFHSVSRLLFQPSEPVRSAMVPYLAKSKDCVVGMHLRHRKKLFVSGPQHRQFVGITRSLAREHRDGNIFVASDKDVFQLMTTLLGDFRVWWSNMTQLEVTTYVGPGGNPGTELSGIVDMMLLARCKHIIVTPGSSFGYVAAALAGIRPVFATFGHHDAPFVNPWFWQSITSEPCMYKCGANEQASLGITLDVLKAKHPLYIYHNQCHP